jgi:5-hydroxyisourate hydrolase-like protein (transthyretin family)
MSQLSLSRCARMLSRFSHLIRFAIPMSIAVVLLGAGLLAGRISQVRAEQVAVAPDAPGSISGKVTDQHGAPLAGVQVDLYTFYSFWSQSPMRTTTDSNGAYKIPLLPTGTYRLGFVDPTKANSERFFPNSPTVDDAQNVSVAGYNVTGIDVAMQPGGNIVGTFFVIPPGVYVPGMTITAYRQQAKEWQAVAWSSYYSSSLAAPVNYALRGLNPGVYRVCAYSQNLGECYDNTGMGIEYATEIVVTRGFTNSDINFVLGDTADLATISGQITAPNGDPVEGIRATILRPHASISNSWLAVASTRTNSSGLYSFQWVMPSTYTLVFVDDTLNRYLREFYDNSLSIEQATLMGVNRFEHRTNVDVVMGYGGTLTGRISVLGEPSESSVFLTPNNPVGAYPPPAYYTKSDPTNGRYQIGGLPSGNYIVKAVTTFFGLDYSGYYGSQDFVSAQPVSVTVPLTVANIDIDLGHGRFEGKIVGHVTHLGTPLANIQVELYRGYSYTPIYTTSTDTNGDYSVEGLLDDFYQIGFKDLTGVYAHEYYPNRVSLEQFPDLSVTGNNSPVHADADLIKSGSIGGSVYYLDGSPQPDTEVSIWLSLFDGSSIATTITDAAGNYTLTGLYPSKYIVRFFHETFAIGPYFYHQRWNGTRPIWWK